MTSNNTATPATTTPAAVVSEDSLYHVKDPYFYVKYYALPKDSNEQAKQSRLNSKQRLLKDWKEIEQNPLPTIYAAPLEKNIYEWHVNLVGVEGTDYEGICIHLAMIFPNDYPMVRKFFENCNIFALVTTQGSAAHYRIP